jgi:ATP synthase protein I
MNGPSEPSAPAPGGDPWAAFGYLVAGVGFYGLLGWGLSVWLHAEYWIPIGILVGAGFGLYLVFSRYLIRGSNKFDLHGDSPADTGDSGTTDIDDAAQAQRPASNDRGETA